MSEEQVPGLKVSIELGGWIETRYIQPQTIREGQVLQDLLLRVVAAFQTQYDRSEIRFRLKGLKQEEDEMRADRRLPPEEEH